MDSDDVKELFVVPQTKEGIITIEVPNKDFLETLPFRSYKLNNQKLTMNINCDAFDFSISLSLSSDFTLPIIFNGKVSPKEYYRDNDSAIKWAHFFNYMFSGEDFYLREISSGALNIAKADIDGDASNNLEAFESVIRYMHDKNFGYGSVNHPVDRDPVCGYVGIIGETCPRCGRKSGEALTMEQIEELRNKYGNRAIPVKCC